MGGWLLGKGDGWWLGVKRRDPLAEQGECEQRFRGQG